MSTAGNIARYVRNIPPGSPPPQSFNGRRRLTEEQVREIRRLHKPNDRTTGSCALARRFGVANQTIDLIVKGVNWSWLP